MSPWYPSPGSYLVSRVMEYILCQGRVPFVARQFNIPLKTLDLVVIQSDLHQIVQIFLLRVHIINSDLPMSSKYFILWGDKSNMNQKVSDPPKHRNPCNSGNSAPIPTILFITCSEKYSKIFCLFRIFYFVRGQTLQILQSSGVYVSHQKP